MPLWIVVTAVMLVPALMAAAFLLGRHLHRRQGFGNDLSPVTRQHIDLFQGGQLSEAAVEAAKSRLGELLERGEMDAVEASLRPGTHYVIQVRALAEIGTDEAGRILWPMVFVTSTVNKACLTCCGVRSWGAIIRSVISLRPKRCAS